MVLNFIQSKLLKINWLVKHQMKLKLLYETFKHTIYF